MAPELDGILCRVQLSQSCCLQLSIKMKIQPEVSDKNLSPRQQRFGLSAGSQAGRIWIAALLGSALGSRTVCGAGSFRGEKLLLNCSKAPERVKLKGLTFYFLIKERE